MPVQTALPKPGARVGAGPDLKTALLAQGIVLCHAPLPLGSCAIILMDAGSTAKCYRLTQEGMGWYLIPRRKP